MKKYLNSFFRNENGVELIEFLSIVAVAALLIVIGVRVGQQVNQHMKNISSYV